MSNETIATETTEAVGELPIDELLSDGITNTPPSFVRAILAAASDPDALMAKLVEEFKAVQGDVYTTAERLICNDVIAPHETRKRLIQQLDILSTKNRDMCFVPMPKKRQGIRPV